MERFDRIYFDTSALINASRPRGNALETIRQRAKDLSIVLCIPAPVNVEASRRFDGPSAVYESSIADLMKQWPIQIIPFPEKSLKEAFSELVVRDALNRYSDGDFRDTVIYQSVVEHLYRRPARGVFVSDDFGNELYPSLHLFWIDQGDFVTLGDACARVFRADGLRLANPFNMIDRSPTLSPRTRRYARPPLECHEAPVYFLAYPPGSDIRTTSKIHQP